MPLVDLYLRLGDEARLIGVAQDGVLVLDGRFKCLVKPVPNYSCLKNHAASRIPLEQMPSFQNRVPVIDDAEGALVVMEVDADINRPAWLMCSLAHRLPFYTIGFMRFRSLKRTQNEAARGFHVI
jgi:hypothetical protein